MSQFLAPIINDQQEDANGKPLSGGLIEVYIAGTSTPATTTSDKAGIVPNSWPIVLNTLGVNSQGAVWLTGGSAYKYLIKSSTGVLQRTIDNISGINDTTVTTDQWVVYQGEPTYVSATSFTVAGDQTQIFQINRRLKSANTGGTIYSTITNSVYSAPNTTVTVRNDSGTLDSGLSQVSYGLISVQDSSITGLLLNVQTFTAAGTYTPTPGTTSVIVEAIGGGGGGGGAAATTGSTAACGAGGGSGSYAKGRFTSGFAGLTVTPGAAGGAGGVGASGGNGGTTTFGGLVSCPGGAGGQGGTTVTPPTYASAVSAGGAAPTGGNINASPGREGFPGETLSLSQVKSGKGADSPLGAGGLTRLNTSGTGFDGTGYGSGGSGAASGASGGGFLGGNGRPGIVIVYEYA